MHLVDQLLEILNKNYTASFSKKMLNIRESGSKEYNVVIMMLFSYTKILTSYFD